MGLNLLSPSMRKSQSKGKRIETKLLEQETRKMEERLMELKKQVELQKTQRLQVNDTGSRWKQANTNVPLRGYANKVLEDQKQLFKKHGITSTSNFTKRPSSTSGSSTLNEKPQGKTGNGLFLQVPTQATEDSVQPNVKIENTLGKAMLRVHQVQTVDSVESVLISLGLQQYRQMFEKNHIDDIELINKELLEEMGIPPGHRIKILKKVGEKKATDKTDKRERIEKTGIPEKQEKKQEQQQQEVVFTERDVSFEQESNSEEEGGRFLEGDYDEERNAREFQEALKAYRGVYKEIENIALQTDNPPALTKPISSACFNCYRTFSRQPLTSNNRTFCSEVCLKKYEASRTGTCGKCQKIFNLLQGFCHDGVRYCRVECSPEVRRMQQLFIQWKRADNQARP